MGFPELERPVHVDPGPVFRQQLFSQNSMTSIHPEIFGSGRFLNQVHNLEFCREIVAGLCVYGRDAMSATEMWRCNWMRLSPWDLEMSSGSLASRSRRGQWMRVGGRR